MPTGQYIRGAERKRCEIEGCGRVHNAKGLCGMHYRRKWLYGDVNTVNKKKRKTPKSIHGRDYPRSEEVKNKLRNLRKGLDPWNKGVKRFDIRGDKNWQWKGSIVDLRKYIRTSFEYKEWRKKIFSRDNYTCVLCFKRGGITIHADHHPIGFSKIIRENNIKTVDDSIKCELLWDINNGRTICVDCHKKTPNYMRNV